jgi:pimeloyl-ACP methyl ester carboxylesterase
MEVMPETLLIPRRALARSTFRTRFAALERPLIVAGLALVTVHLLDLALAGPATSALGVLGILAVPAAAVLLRPRVSRATRFALAVPLGLLFASAAAVAHGLHATLIGADWGDVTGIGAALGGLSLIAGGCAALAAPAPLRRAGRDRGLAHMAGWLAGALVIGQFALLPLVAATVMSHAVRLPVDSAALPIAHSDVRLRTADGDAIAGWYVPSRNGAALVVVHGSGGSRKGTVRHVELLARHGYGVLAIDLPGHGESGGHANLLGANAQPAVTAAVDWLSRRSDVDPRRIGGLGLSLGAEVLLEAAARDVRIHTVVADGAERASDDRVLGVGTGLERAVGAAARTATRAITGMREAPPLTGLVPRIAPRRALLVAAGGRPDEIPVNRAYQTAAGSTAELWTLPDTPHTQGLARHPAVYETRVIAFLDGALR